MNKTLAFLVSSLLVASTNYGATFYAPEYHSEIAAVVREQEVQLQFPPQLRAQGYLDAYNFLLNSSGLGINYTNIYFTTNDGTTVSTITYVNSMTILQGGTLILFSIIPPSGLKQYQVVPVENITGISYTLNH